MNQDARDAMTRARTALILDQPFFGALALALTLVEEDAIPTAAVDGISLFYNPSFILDQSDRIKLSVVAHEVVHCAFDHMGREGEREHGKWNRACDYADNLVLYDNGFDIPADWLMDEQYRGMSAEHIYTLLPDDDPNDPAGGGGNPGPGEPGGSMDDIRRAPAGVDPGELSREWTVNVLQAAQVAKSAGKLPGSLELLVESIAAPSIDWRTLLRRFVTERTNDDYSWTRPNRRMIVHGVYLPSLYTEALGMLDVAVDSSMSMMDEATLAAIAGELDDIIATARPRQVRVIYCDYEVRKVQTIERDAPFTFDAIGGGGTRFKPVFDWIEASGELPSALVYLTDLEGPTSFMPPPYPVLWCTVTDLIAPWGETLRIKL